MTNLEALRAALVQSPDNLPLLLLYAQASTEELRFAEAQVTYEGILQRDPYHKDAQLGLAQAFFLQGRVSEAAVRAERILQNDADYAPAHLFLSRIHLSEDNKPQALEHYQRALMLDAAISDPGLDKDLGKLLKAPRKSPASVQSDMQMPWDMENGDDDFPFDDGFYEEVTDFRPDSFFGFPQIEKPKVDFSDVGGMDDLKEEMRMKALYPQQRPDLFKAYGKKSGGALLLYGPPGCGKSMMARAAAGEMGMNLIPVNIHEIFDAYLGNSEKNLHQIFEYAKANAPAVLFFDEVEAFATDRRNLREAQVRNLVNQFLVELDNLCNLEQSNVLIIAATNAPWHIDPAFRRPGRFDRGVFVPPPDFQGRAAIVEMLSAEKPTAGINHDKLAEVTRGYSGADLKQLFELAADEALSQALHEDKIVPIKTATLLRALPKMLPSTLAWFESARNHLIYANQTGLYNDVLEYLKNVEKD